MIKKPFIFFVSWSADGMTDTDNRFVAYSWEGFKDEFIRSIKHRCKPSEIRVFDMQEKPIATINPFGVDVYEHDNVNDMLGIFDRNIFVRYKNAIQNTGLVSYLARNYEGYNAFDVS